MFFGCTKINFPSREVSAVTWTAGEFRDYVLLINFHNSIASVSLIYIYIFEVYGTILEPLTDAKAFFYSKFGY
jgi:hypothetical protein